MFEFHKNLRYNKVVKYIMGHKNLIVENPIKTLTN